MIDRTLKEELKALSKELFGASSRWQKILDNGLSELKTEEVTEYVPGATDEEEGTTRQVQVPVKHNYQNMMTKKRLSPEELKTYLLSMKKQRESILEQIKKMQEEAKAKKEAEEHLDKVSKELSGSAL